MTARPCDQLTDDELRSEIAAVEQRLRELAPATAEPPETTGEFKKIFARYEDLNLELQRRGI